MTPDAFIAWRRRLDFTQQEAADALGVTKRTVQLYEAGEQPVEKRTRLAMAAVALGLKDFPGE